MPLAMGFSKVNSVAFRSPGGVYCFSIQHHDKKFYFFKEKVLNRKGFACRETSPFRRDRSCYLRDVPASFVVCRITPLTTTKKTPH